MSCHKILILHQPPPSGPLQATIHYAGVCLKIKQITCGRVVFEAHLGHLEFRIYGHPQDVLAMVKAAYIHPLTVNIVLVDVVAVN